jgi:hypothetical protein
MKWFQDRGTKEEEDIQCPEHKLFFKRLPPGKAREVINSNKTA